MSVLRSIKRQMVREAIQENVALGKLACPKCGCRLIRKNIISDLARCPNCKWWGKITMKRRIIK